MFFLCLRFCFVGEGVSPGQGQGDGRDAGPHEGVAHEAAAVQGAGRVSEEDIPYLLCSAALAAFTDSQSRSDFLRDGVNETNRIAKKRIHKNGFVKPIRKTDSRMR